MIKLKPCPFCGAIPVLDRSEIFCDCGAKMEIPLYGTNDGYSTYGEAKEEMIEAWNTRVGE